MKPIDSAISAVDAHFHVFDPKDRGLLVRGGRYKPGVATAEEYLARATPLGISHSVLVQPSVYGTDNSALLRMLKRHTNWRGVAVLDPAVSDAALEQMNIAGVCGVRVNLVQGGGPELPQMQDIFTRIRTFGWHVQLVGRSEEIMKPIARLARYGITTVVDHCGWPSDRNDRIGLASYLACLADNACWVKLSGPYRLGGSAPSYPELQEWVAALADRMPQRLVWGSDWPHPDFRSRRPVRIEDQWHWVRTALPKALQARVLTENPAQLYGW